MIPSLLRVGDGLMVAAGDDLPSLAVGESSSVAGRASWLRSDSQRDHRDVPKYDSPIPSSWGSVSTATHPTYFSLDGYGTDPP